MRSSPAEGRQERLKISIQAHQDFPSKEKSIPYVRGDAFLIAERTCCLLSEGFSALPVSDSQPAFTSWAPARLSIPAQPWTFLFDELPRAALPRRLLIDL
jgi:hypothetical protein